MVSFDVKATGVPRGVEGCPRSCTEAKIASILSRGKCWNPSLRVLSCGGDFSDPKHPASGCSQAVASMLPAAASSGARKDSHMKDCTLQFATRVPDSCG